MNGWLAALGPEGTALALLILGHMLGDFIFQTDEMANNKHQTRTLLSHIGIVFIVHAVALLRFKEKAPWFTAGMNPTITSAIHSR